jgi:putative SOS response-associated peptidase YedK
VCGRYYRRSDKQRIAEAYRLGEIPFDLVLPDWNFNVAPMTFQPVIRICPHPSDKNKSVARVHPTDQDLSVGTPVVGHPGSGLGWGTQLSHPSDKNKSVARVGHPESAGGRELVLMRWGLVPSYTKQLADVKGISTINARAETVEKSPVWRGPFKRRRCLVPADGFYEWKRVGEKSEAGAAKNSGEKTKQPYAFHLKDEAPFAFAGLWDAWRAPDESWLFSFSIVTTRANALMAPVHDRMPVILKPGDYDRWLDVEADAAPLDLLRPYAAEAMACAPANPKVGNTRNNGPEMLECPTEGQEPVNSA